MNAQAASWSPPGLPAPCHLDGPPLVHERRVEHRPSVSERQVEGRPVLPDRRAEEHPSKVVSHPVEEPPGLSSGRGFILHERGAGHTLRRTSALLQPVTFQQRETGVEGERFRLGDVEGDSSSSSSLVDSDSKNENNKQHTKHKEKQRRHPNGSTSYSEDAKLCRKHSNVKAFVLLPTPAAGSLDSCLMDVYTTSCGASNWNRRRTMRWLKEIEMATEAKDIEYVSSRWDALSSALSDAVLGIASGALKRELIGVQTLNARRCEPLPGRVAFWYLLRLYELDKGSAHRADLTDMLALKAGGDLESFFSG